MPPAQPAPPRPTLVPAPALAGGTRPVRELRGRSSVVRLETLADPRAPRPLHVVFITMYGMLVLLAAHQLIGLGGTRLDSFFNHWVNNAIFIGAASATAWRALRIEAERLAWALVAASLLVYAAGDITWSVFFADSAAAVTFADVFYLTFPLLLFAGIVSLVRARIGRFELERWIDGLAAALLVAAPAIVLVLEPTIRESEGSLLVKVVTVAYPMTDIVLLGSVVGVIALAGWHPGRAWLTFAAGLACFVAADTFYAVENLSGTYSIGGAYEFLWPAAGLLIATSGWLQPLRHVEVHAWGWRAIALPVLCQLAPMALMFLTDDPPSERLLMSAVLGIVLVQLVVTRPVRPPSVE